MQMKLIATGMLMTMTKDGDYAPLVFIPMIWCCGWTSNLSFFDDPDYIDNYDGYHLRKMTGQWLKKAGDIMSRVSATCIHLLMKPLKP